MLKKLRMKFVVINMLLVSAVLIAVIAVQIGSTFRQTRETMTSALQLALLRDENAPVRWELEGQPPELAPEPRPNDEPKGERGLGAFIPTVAVSLDADGAITELRENNVDVSDETIQAAVAAVLAGGTEEGVLSQPDLRYLVHRDESGAVTAIAFADRTWATTSLQSQILTSGLLFVAAFLGFLVISLFLSRWALRPVEKSWQQQRQFMADASHELKTPLTVMLADANILLAHPSETVESQRKWVEYIQDEGERMKQLVEDMLFLTRSEDANERGMVRARVALSDLAWSCLLPFEAVAFETGVTLDGEVEPELTLLGDEEQLRRLIAILLDNACKYAGPKGAVTLRLSRRGEKLELAVHNTGDPIPPEAQAHLFERFYRADAARERSKGGYGLGLAIAQSIAQNHGGKIAVASAPATGTTFTVTLPEK